MASASSSLSYTSKFCSTPEDIFGNILPAFKSTMMFIDLINDRKLIKIDCYNHKVIKKVIDNSEIFEDYPKKEIKLFKLPNMGIWVRYIPRIMEFNTFILIPVGIKKIGSEFGVSRLHGAEEKVYTLAPINRDTLLNILNTLPEKERYDKIKSIIGDNVFYPSKNDIIYPSYWDKSYIELSDEKNYGIIVKDANTFEGEIKNDEPNGYGEMIYSDESVYEGDWVNGLRDGTGIFTTYINDSALIYEGEWVKDKREGKGEERLEKNIIYKGDWKNNEYNGIGTLYLPTGIYKGEVANNVRNGKGKMDYKNGNVYEGEWKDDKQNGNGKMIYKNGKVYEGKWKDDKPVSVGDEKEEKEGKEAKEDDAEENNMVSCGNLFTLILKNGIVYASGRNERGQLGLGDDDDRDIFTKVDIDNVKSISCGASSSFILKNDGTLYSCGSNMYGLSGLGSEFGGVNIFTQVNINNIKSISCGYDFTFAIKNDGTVYSCGSNATGQLGLGNNNNRYEFTKVNINNVNSISCGYDFAFALKNDGTVYACGGNSYGQLGLLENDTNVFTKVNINDIKSISCGMYHTFALKNDGTIYSCGKNLNGELGLEIEDTMMYEFTKVDIDDIKYISCGTGFTFVVKNNGNVYACGNNRLGQLGLGVHDDQFSHFNLVTVLTDAKSIGCGSNFAVALTDEDEIYVTGSNGFGQLGTGEDNNEDEFIDIGLTDY